MSIPVDIQLYIDCIIDVCILMYNCKKYQYFSIIIINSRQYWSILAIIDKFRKYIDQNWQVLQEFAKNWLVEKFGKSTIYKHDRV